MLFLFIRFCLCIIVGFSSHVMAAQWAKVISEKAIIYADQKQTAPIGYLVKGKKVRVGEVVRHHGELLPIVVTGKIAYIKVTDLDISFSTELLVSPAERLSNKANEKIIEQRLAITYAALATNVDVADSQESVVFSGGGLRGYLVDLKKRRSWRIGVDLLTVSVLDNYSFDIFSVTGEYAIHLLQSGSYDFHFYGGLSLIPYAQFSSKGDFKENGYGAGASAGVEMIFKFTDSVGFHFDGNYQYSQLIFPLNPSVKNALNVDKYEPTFGGFKFSAAISFLFD